jgi:hypothetical protein
MDTPDELEPIQLSEGKIVEIKLRMINLTGIPDEAFTPADDVWGDDLASTTSPNGAVAPHVPPTIPTPPKSV